MTLFAGLPMLKTWFRASSASLEKDLKRPIRVVDVKERPVNGSAVHEPDRPPRQQRGHEMRKYARTSNCRGRHEVVDPRSDEVERPHDGVPRSPATPCA